MLRRFLSPPPTAARTEPWTHRGQSPGRLENFSDCTFSFALTLLVIATEVPKSYDDLVRILPGFFSFGACFVILCVLWQRHVVFFRRYGLSDTPTVALNTALLGLMLFYLYPLKFLMNALVEMFRGAFVRLGAGPHTASAGGLNGPALLMARALPLYLIGFAAVALAFALLYRHALRRRVELKLSPYEERSTRDDMVLWCVATIAATLASAWCFWAPLEWAPYGNFMLFTIPLVRRAQRARRRRSLAEVSSPAVSG
jgi:uncharacterized membrane protein